VSPRRVPVRIDKTSPKKLHSRPHAPHSPNFITGPAAFPDRFEKTGGKLKRKRSLNHRV
jgi:hypothetical protein